METNESWGPIDWANHYRDQGIRVIPASDGHPTKDWRAFQTEPVPETLHREWFAGTSFRGVQIYAICGKASNLVVLDCDSEGAERWWRTLIGDVVDQTARVLSGGGRGHHYYFRLGEQEQRSRSGHYDHPELGSVKWDLRGEKGGVVMPPSHHRSGGRYQWEVGLDAIQPWPYPEIPGRGAHSHEGASPNGDAQSLAWLLTHPGDGGRNNWVTSVLGHYAKRIPFYDGYQLTAEMVYHQALGVEADHPYERAEFDATVQSVWSAEREKTSGVGRPQEDTGLLSGDGQRLYTLCKTKSGEVVTPFAQFDVRATSMITDPLGRTSYIMDVTRDTPEGPDVLNNAVLEAERLGSNDALSKWMSARRMIVTPPAHDLGAGTPRPTRFQMYLEAQSPRKVRSAPWMGWHDDEELGPVYVTEQGLITASGLQTDPDLIPDPRRQVIHNNWFYGFDDTPEAAMAILRELLTYHDPVTTSVFGAMWALAPIKGELMRISSLFPHLAVVAPSEAGKTNGFFDLMLQANGRCQAGGTLTAASLRDDLAAHRGGFVWVDDPSNIDDIGDLLRSAANEGNYSKKGGVNWQDTIVIPLVAPLVISAEGVEMLRERAMADRVVELDVPSPVGRQSERGQHPQWDDILELQHNVGHLSRYAGWYVQRVWQWLDVIGGSEGLRRLAITLRVGTGRQSEKLALVRLGARALAWVAGCDRWQDVLVRGTSVGGVGSIDPVEIVDAWAQGTALEDKRGPYIVSVVLPSYFSAKGFVPSYKSAPVEPVYIDNHGHLRVNVQGLAAWWLNHSRSRSDRDRAQQLGAPGALRAEARMLDWSVSTPIKGKRYHTVPLPDTQKILAEAGYDWVDLVTHTDRLQTGG